MEFFSLDADGEGEREAVAASVDVPLDSTNVGFRLLKKMGWKENTGLGRDGSGTYLADDPPLILKTCPCQLPVASPREPKRRVTTCSALVPCQ